MQARLAKVVVHLANGPPAVNLVGLPARFRHGGSAPATGELCAIRQSAPWLDQHSAELPRGIGYGGPDIDALFNAGVIYDKYRQEAPK